LKRICVKCRLLYGRMTKKGIEPCVHVQEFVNPSMVPFVLPTALQIARDTTDTDFVLFILPGREEKRCVLGCWHSQDLKPKQESSVANRVTFWYGTDLDLRIRPTDSDLDPTPDPAIFVTDLQD